MLYAHPTLDILYFMTTKHIIINSTSHIHFLLLLSHSFSFSFFFFFIFLFLSFSVSFILIPFHFIPIPFVSFPFSFSFSLSFLYYSATTLEVTTGIDLQTPFKHEALISDNTSPNNLIGIRVRPFQSSQIFVLFAGNSSVSPYLINNDFFGTIIIITILLL